MKKVAIIGATGPTGIHLAYEWRAIGAVRVVARKQEPLERLFPASDIEKVPADVTDADAARRAIDGCDLVYDCIGLPGDQMHLHPVTARNLAAAVRRAGARCIQVSSYWAYLPLVRPKLDEQHPRTDGPPYVRYRREAEDVLQEAGAAILNLPDFYGPHVHTSTLQNPLAEAAAGKTMNWIGGPEVEREYVYVADAMRIARRISEFETAFGTRWILPGCGPLSGQRLAESVGRHLGREVKLRAAGPAILRLVSLFNRDLRGFMQVAPDYTKPIAYDASKLEALLGKQKMTPYESGVARTLDWIRAHDYQP